MYEELGAAVQADGSVTFSLFFPDNAPGQCQYTRGGPPRVRTLKVTGDFQAELGGGAWDPESACVMECEQRPEGSLYRYETGQPLPEGYYEYKYLVEFENHEVRYCTDPCTKYGGSLYENAGFVVGGRPVEVRPLAQRLPWQDLVIYELMIDDFTAGSRQDRAPIDAVRDKLDYLVDLGVNAIAFMPWTAWPGNQFSWGYNPFLYFAVEFRYIEDPDRPADKLFWLGRLIDECHARGIHVIMDGVFNHVEVGRGSSGFPYYWLYQDPEESPYVGPFGQGGFFQDLDFSNQCTCEFILSVCRYWIDWFKIDGIRYDYVRGILEGDFPTLGLPKLLADLNRHLAQSGQEGFLHILEHMTDNRYNAIRDTNRIPATNCWYDPLFAQTFDALRHRRVSTGVMRALDTNRDFAVAKGPVTYVENHDHTTISFQAGGRDKWWRIQPYLIALFTTPGAVMIHNGQEFGQAEFLPEDDADLPPDQKRVIPRPLDWGLSEDEIGSTVRALHRKLAGIRQSHPALRSPNFYPRFYDEGWQHLSPEGYGVDIDRSICIYHRWGETEAGSLERFIVVLNFSERDQWTDVPFSTNGRWADLLTSAEVEVSNFRLADQLIPSNWGKVYHQCA